MKIPKKTFSFSNKQQRNIFPQQHLQSQQFSHFFLLFPNKPQTIILFQISNSNFQGKLLKIIIIHNSVIYN